MMLILISPELLTSLWSREEVLCRREDTWEFYGTAPSSAWSLLSIPPSVLGEADAPGEMYALTDKKGIGGGEVCRYFQLTQTYLAACLFIPHQFW